MRISNSESSLNKAYSWRLKTLLLGPKISISFAGKPVYAYELFNKLTSKNYNLEQVIRGALDSHISSNQETEYLIASTEIQTVMFTIKNSKLERRLDSAWLGDQAGFSAFQEINNRGDEDQLYHNQEQKVFGKYQKSFSELVTKNSVKSVGDFYIIAMANFRSQYQFMYLPRIEQYAGLIPKEITSAVKGPQSLFNDQSSEEGGYSYTVITPLNLGVSILAIHFQQPRLGILYNLYSSQAPEKYPDVTCKEFIRALQAKIPQLEFYKLCPNDEGKPTIFANI